MAEFFAELKRRHIYRVGAAYALVAWLLLQIVNNVAPGLNLPNWAITLVIVLLAIGFPVALLFCWIQHLPDGAAQQTKTSRLDWMLVGGLATVIAIFLFQQVAQQASAPVSQSQSPAGAISIAVLPFANVSGDSSQEFFSDGMTDEIIAALARIPSLQVVARTSAFQFKGERRDMRAVGQALGARYLIDGSVRKEGNRVRISAQLVQADNGVGVWTNSYDRELTSVFAIQEDIAGAIAASLRVPLGLQQGERLVSNRSIDPDSYEQFLRAKAIVRSRTGVTPLGNATSLLEQVVARDPNYAPAWSLLALAYALTPTYDPTSDQDDVDEFRGVVEASLSRAEQAARRAIQSDANLADPYISLARAQDARGKHLAAEELYAKALAMDPYNPDALNLYTNLLAGAGRLKETLAIKQKVLAVEPFVPIYNQNAASILWLNGQTDAAIAMFKALPPGVGRATRLAPIYAAEGRYREAADVLQEIPSGTYRQGIVEDAVRLLRMAPATAPSPQTLPRLGTLSFVYLHVGAPDRALDYHEGHVQAGYMVAFNNSQLWHPSYAAVRKTERFKAYIRKTGLVEYWRVKGWPEFCRPVGADDFECE